MLAFIVVVAVSFIVAATNLTGLVSSYLTQQRTREDTQAAENLAEAAGPLFETADFEGLNTLLAESGESLDGRVLVLDNDGKVQFDSFNALCGRRLGIPEVLKVLTGGESEAYGMHRESRENVERMSGETNAEYVAYCAREMRGSGGRIGALLYVSRIQSMMDSQRAVSLQLISMFIVIALATLILALILSRVLTSPITALSRTMNKMGKGDLSVRVPVKGSGELRELAENYNTMAAQLENLDKTRNQFVSNASHELKTPLATMKIMLETMIYQPDMPAELREEFMQDMNHEIDRLTGIITDLLTLTRMDNSDGSLKLEKIDISGLTDEVVRRLRPAAEKKNQNLEEDIAPGLEMIGDKIKLYQVLYNLVDNATKYTPSEGTISVSLAEEGDNLVWKVADNGIGIPEEDREHIFERFYRVDKARSRETGGTGLGLSIVKQLVNMHGGEIDVESRPGEGSVFIVRLPAHAGEEKSKLIRESGGEETPDGDYTLEDEYTAESEYMAEEGEKV